MRDAIRDGSDRIHELQELRSRLLSAVRRRCPPWLAADAEDIAQTAMIRILEIQRRGGGTVAFGPSYLEKVAYTAMIDAIRARFRRREAPEPPEDLVAVTSAPAAPMIDLDLEAALRACMAGLDSSRRVAVACRLLGYSAPESSGLLGWTPKKIEHLVRRGLQELRECLIGKGVEP